MTGAAILAVWVLRDPEDDGHIYGVYSSKEAAKRGIKRLHVGSFSVRIDEHEVED